jgi:hypothetical protein
MTSRTIWQRRAVLMAAIGLLVAIPVTLLIRDGDGTEPTETTPAAVPEVGPAQRDGGLGVRYQVAERWEERKEASAIRLRSPDRQAEIVIAAPGPADRTGAILEEALAALRSGYENVDINPGSGVTLGGLKTKGAVASVRTREGARLRVVVAVAEGDRRAHLVEVFTASAVPTARVREAQVMLNSLEFLR